MLARRTFKRKPRRRRQQRARQSETVTRDAAYDAWAALAAGASSNT